MMETTIERDGQVFKAYRCDVCGGLDAREDSLERHKRRHVMAGLLASGAMLGGQRYGTRQLREKRLCSVEGCGAKMQSRGLCPKHYHAELASRFPEQEKNRRSKRNRFRGYLP